MKGFEGLLGNPLFQAGMGILSANAPSLTPPNYMGGAMKGLMQGAQYAQQQKEMEIKKRLYDAQIKEMEDQAAERKRTEMQRLKTDKIFSEFGLPQELANRAYGSLESQQNPNNLTLDDPMLDAMMRSGSSELRKAAIDIFTNRRNESTSTDDKVYNLGPGAALVNTKGEVLHRNQLKGFGFVETDIPLKNGSTMRGLVNKTTGRITDLMGNVISPHLINPSVFAGFTGGNVYPTQPTQSNANQPTQSNANEQTLEINQTPPVETVQPTNIVQQPTDGTVISEATSPNLSVTGKPSQVDSKVISDLAANGVQIGLSQTPGEKVEQEKRAEAKVKNESEKPEAKKKMRLVTSSMQRLADKALSLKEHPGLNRVTGYLAGRFPLGALTQQGTNALTEIKHMKDVIFKDALAEMRQASPGGGAVGNVSDREGDRLENMMQNLDKAQDYETYKERLQALNDQIIKSIEIIQDAYNEQYGNMNDVPDSNMNDVPDYIATDGTDLTNAETIY